MKKRLFISSILMTLVLLVAITTATFAWYTASSYSASGSSTQAITTVKNSTQNGSATLSVESTEFFKFNKTAAAANAPLLPATNEDDDSCVKAGTFAQIVSDNTWKTYVDNGGTPYEDTTGEGSSNAAYVVITYKVVIVATDYDLGDYTITLEHAAGWDNAIVVTREGLSAAPVTGENPKVGNNTFAELVVSGGSANNTFTMNTNAAAGSYYFRVILWVDGTQSLPGTPLAAANVLTVSIDDGLGD